MIQDAAVQKTYLTGDVHTKFLEGYRDGAADYDLVV